MEKNVFMDLVAKMASAHVQLNVTLINMSQFVDQMVTR